MWYFSKIRAYNVYNFFQKTSGRTELDQKFGMAIQNRRPNVVVFRIDLFRKKAKNAFAI
jgi:hypothetical protein